MDLTSAQIKRIMQKRKDEVLYKNGKIKKKPPTWEELNREFGCPAANGESLRKWFCDRFIRKRVSNYSPPDMLDHTTDYQNNPEKPCGPDIGSYELLEMYGYNPKYWEVSSSRSSKLSNGKVSSSVSVKPKAQASGVDIEAIIKRCLEYTTPADWVSSVQQSNDVDYSSQYMLEIAISDLHLGKRFFDGGGSVETENAYKRAVDRFIKLAENKNIEEVILLVGNDFFNFDGISGSTTKGTPQSNDMSWTSVFECGVKMAVDAIEKLSKLANVKVVYVPSNHDRQAGWYMAKVLEAKYSGSHRVFVDASISPRKYEKYGNNMLIFWHGDGDTKRTLQAIPLEAPEMFSSTKYRELHTGHLHHIEDNESGGITHRTLPTFTLPDEWHMNQCYVGTVPRTSAYLWNKFDGLEQIFYVNF